MNPGTLDRRISFSPASVTTPPHRKEYASTPDHYESARQTAIGVPCRDATKCLISIVNLLLAQSANRDRPPPTRARPFFPLYSAPQNAGLAQLVVHLICNQGVGGSNPSAGTNTPSVNQAVSLHRASPISSVVR
jgi:hypothetical protein